MKKVALDSISWIRTVIRYRLAPICELTQPQIPRITQIGSVSSAQSAAARSKCRCTIQPARVEDVGGKSAFGGNLPGSTHRIESALERGRTNPEIARDHLLGDEPFAG